jgi:hypothetical protein
MRVLVYKCNNCEKELKNAGHLSINFGGWSGYVSNKSGKWKHIENAVRKEGIKQFCGMKCLREYFLRKI